MHRRFISRVFLAGMVWSAPGMSSLAADPAHPHQRPAPGSLALETWWPRTLSNWRWPEIVEMIWALARGSEMSPGEGWFHPGQSRYGWDWLAARYDADKNGRITREEFQGPSELFDRLDRDGDAALTAEDFDWSDRSPFLREMRMTAQWFRCIDANSNGRVSRAEWDRFFTGAAKGKNHLTREDLREALNPPQLDKDEPSPLVLILGLLSGELGSLWEGPGVNEKAPQFALQTQDDKRRVCLSDFRGKKPVVLVFGSFT